MDYLDLDSIELISQTRTAPENGAPSSADFNDLQRENLSDLVAIVGFLNDQLMPILRTLSADASAGLNGSNIITDPEENSALFKDSNGNALTVSESLRVLHGMLQTLDQHVSDLDANVGELTQRLSSTGQNDVANALRGFQDALNSLGNRVLTLEQA